MSNIPYERRQSLKREGWLLEPEAEVWTSRDGQCVKESLVDYD